MVTAKSNGGVRKERRVCRELKLSPAISYSVHNNDLTTLTHAVEERVFKVKDGFGRFVDCPQPEDAFIIRRVLSKFSEKLQKEILSTPTFVYTPEQFSACYDGRKRKIYDEAGVAFTTRGVDRKDSWVHPFVKAEKYTKLGAVPRVIQARGPVYNLAVGCYLKPLEHQVFDAIDRVFGSKTVFKGLNAERRGKHLAKKWFKFADPVALALDVSRFDQHCSVPALRWEHKQYLLAHDPADRAWLGKLLSWQLRNTGVSSVCDGEIKYTKEGCRMSGDMNTSLGNVLLMCSMIWSFMQEMNVKCELANDGDDCSLMFEKRDLEKVVGAITPWFLRLGYEIVVEGTANYLEEIKFCQCHPIWTKRGYVMLRAIPVSLAKDCVTFKTLESARAWMKWRKEIGDCGACLASGMPIAQNFYQTLLKGLPVRLRTGFQQTMQSGMLWLSKGMKNRVVPIEEATRVSFWRAFGITPETQFELEEYYDSVTLSYNPVLSDLLHGEDGFTTGAIDSWF